AVLAGAARLAALQALPDPVDARASVGREQPEAHDQVREREGELALEQRAAAGQQLDEERDQRERDGDGAEATQQAREALHQQAPRSGARSELQGNEVTTAPSTSHGPLSATSPIRPRSW